MTWKSVFDAEFKYRRADDTDVRLTFARIRREQRRTQAGGGAPLAAKVVPIGTAPHSAWPFERQKAAS